MGLLETAVEQDGKNSGVTLTPITRADDTPRVVDIRRAESGALVKSGGKLVKRLAVCDRSGKMILAREGEKSDPDDKAKKVRVWQASPALADFADATASGLFAGE